MTYSRKSPTRQALHLEALDGGIQIVELELTPFGHTCSASLTNTIVRGKVLSVDGVELEGPPFFYIRLGGPQHELVDILQGSDLIADLDTGIDQPLELSAPVFTPYVNLRDEDIDVGPHSEVEPSEEASEIDHINQAIQLLESGENELVALKHRLDKQRELVNHLTGGQYPVEDSVIKNCDSWSCVIKAFVEKSKARIHDLYQRIKTYIRKTTKDGEGADMAFMSRVKQTQFSSEKVPEAQASDRPNTKDYDLLSDTKKDDYDSDDFDSDSDTSSIYSSSFRNTTRNAIPDPKTASLHSSLSTTHKIHAALALLLSLLCLTCLTTYLHRRCCNPRAKADRRARREEARNVAEYARAARQHSWKIWWAKHLGLGTCLCCGGRKDQRIQDYEEKRSLIMQQEERLEGYMQEEIRFLTSNVAEEGRAGPLYGQGQRIQTPTMARRSMHESRDGRRHQRREQRHVTRQSRANTTGSTGSNGDSLPSYRSRESSSSGGRPPSYRTRAPSLAQPPLPQEDTLDENLAARLTEQFPLVRNSGDAGDWLVSDDEASPDSSVVDVSPRLSSETIRTERSAFGL